MNLEWMRYLHKLRGQMIEHFNLEELRQFTFGLAVDWDELRGEIKSAKIQALFVALNQENRLPDLIEHLQRERPHADWPPLPTSIPTLIPQTITTKDRNRAILLERIRTFWIQGYLEKSLYDVVRVELGLERKDEAVARPWMMTLTRPQQDDQTIPAGITMLNIFYDLGGYMLILGEPGSGKTITLLELARDLLEIAERDENVPIPIIFNLSSWAQKGGKLFDWLVEQLSLIYKVNKRIGRKWLETEPFTLLLDGLDEVAVKQRNACVKAINDFSQEYGKTKLVVCSRIADYEQLTTRLSLYGAVKIQPLSESQIDAYFAAAGSVLAQAHEAIKAQSWLQELAKTPLFLNVIAFTYRHQEVDISSIHGQKELWSMYVDSALWHRLPEDWYDTNWYTKSQATRWLNYLASLMAQQSQTEFLIENLQPVWLTQARGRKLYRLFAFLIFGLLGSLLGGLIVGLTVGLFLGLTVGRFFGLLGGLTFGLLGGLTFGLLGGLTFGLREIRLREKLTYSWRSGLLGGLIFGLLGSLLGGLIFGLIFALSVDERTNPGEGVRRSGINGLLGGLIGGLIFGLLAELYRRVFFIGWLIGGLIFGLIGGLLGGLTFGGGAFIQHFILRFFLHCYDYLPWKLVPFLNDMASQIILRKIGGSYVFIHRSLLEYFAQLETAELADTSGHKDED